MLSLESPTDTVIYRSKLNPKINCNFEVFDPVDFLATLSQHIPDKGVQMVRYYGLYSNKQRGCARKGTGRSKTAPVGRVPSPGSPTPGPNPVRRRPPNYRPAHGEISSGKPGILLHSNAPNAKKRCG